MAFAVVPYRRWVLPQVAPADSAHPPPDVLDSTGMRDRRLLPLGTAITGSWAARQFRRFAHCGTCGRFGAANPLESIQLRVHR